MNRAALEKYQPTIGIECHVQLRTKTKLFSGANNDARDMPPNTVVSPICFGMPGTLPVLNKQAIVLAVRAGLALNAEIAPVSSFDRKHYFYPDLPKGYQITQLARPTVGKGKIEVPLGEGSFTVRITRAHIEEDAGKLTHPEGADYSLVDLNRAGTPLIEIVSEADMHSPEEARAYVQELYLLMKYAGVTYGDLYQGNMRFDINISVAEKGASELGRRAEIKNLNSFRSVERAASYEFERQVELLEKGQKIAQETRGWDDAKQKTFSQRSKEDAMDYRYFPDADLPPVELTAKDIGAIRAGMPLLPPELRRQLAGYDIANSDRITLILADAANLQESSPRHYVRTVLTVGQEAGAEAAQFAANFIVNREVRYRQDNPDDHTGIPTALEFIAVHALLKQNRLSSNNADALLFALRGKGFVAAQEVEEFAQQQNLLQENNSQALIQIIAEVLADPSAQKATDDIRAGNDKAIGFLVGQVMKKSGGKANPAMVSDLIKKQLG